MQMAKFYCERRVFDVAVQEWLDRVFTIVERQDLPQRIGDAYANGGPREVRKVFKAFADDVLGEITAGARTVIGKAFEHIPQDAKDRIETAFRESFAAELEKDSLPNTAEVILDGDHAA
jgi:hypothetical protein